MNYLGSNCLACLALVWSDMELGDSDLTPHGSNVQVP